MRILRIRRGYTTNSSGSNEWVPPKHLKLLSNAAAGSAEGASGIQTPSGGGIGWSKESKQVTILSTSPGASGQRAANAGELSPPPGPSSGRATANLGFVGLIIGLVTLLFAGTALLRRIFRKKTS